MISAFTGMPVRQHGWNREPGNVEHFPRLPGAPMLAEVLRSKGYATQALVSNAFVDARLGFDRGFDSFDRMIDPQAPERVRKAVSSWEVGGEKQFLYVHLLGPHSPLKPSDATRSHYGVAPEWLEGHRLGFLIGEAKRNQRPGAREAYRAAYHAVVEDTDTRLGAILDALGEHRDDTLIVVTSDHGELLGEHGVFGHGWWVWEELAHVPLVVEGGVPLPDRVSGASLPAIITESLDLEVTWPTPHDADLLVTQRGDKLALSPDGRAKAIWTADDAHQYALPASAERHSLDAHAAEGEPVAVSPALQAARAEWEANTPAGTYSDQEVRLHDDTVESLKALGYLQGGD
jgi:membrane-anchored protein YejM (alkaline phosphatase superfamily)